MVVSMAAGTKFPENYIRDKQKELSHLLVGRGRPNNDNKVYY